MFNCISFQVRLESGNRDFHYTHWSVIIDIFNPRDLKDLSIEPKALPIGGPDPMTFLLSKEEHASLRFVAKCKLNGNFIRQRHRQNIITTKNTINK
jgi:hypothetical protein